jgi:hypothetical protein
MQLLHLLAYVAYGAVAAYSIAGYVVYRQMFREIEEYDDRWHDPYSITLVVTRYIEIFGNDFRVRFLHPKGWKGVVRRVLVLLIAFIITLDKLRG